MSTSINFTVRVFKFGIASGATLFGPSSVGASSHNVKIGRVSVTIVESAALRDGLVQDSKGNILTDGKSSAKNGAQAADGKRNSKTRKGADQLIIVDLP